MSTLSPKGQLSRDEVAHLAHLARLAVTDEELDLFAGQLAAVLDAVAQVGKAAVEEVPPTTHAVPMTNVYRPDVVVASSDKAYGDQEVLPYTEESPLLGRHPYDASKACADIGHLVVDYYTGCDDERVAWQNCVAGTAPGAANWSCTQSAQWRSNHDAAARASSAGVLSSAVRLIPCGGLVSTSATSARRSASRSI